MITVKMKIIVLVFFSVSVALFLFIVNHDYRTVEPKTLCGKYSFNGGGLDSITIFNDHTYKHKFITVSNKQYTETGKWKWNLNEIDFYNFAFFNDKGPSGRGLWMSKVAETDKEIRLIYSSENNICYFKRLVIQK
ncbi:MAG: hypothetical protein JWP37_3296 [Mucilaginibacter sp.]|nr:hypothetical protein [Mucilaginibacter sp.]